MKIVSTPIFRLPTWYYWCGWGALVALATGVVVLPWWLVSGSHVRAGAPAQGNRPIAQRPALDAQRPADEVPQSKTPDPASHPATGRASSEADRDWQALLDSLAIAPTPVPPPEAGRPAASAPTDEPAAAGSNADSNVPDSVTEASPEMRRNHATRFGATDLTETAVDVGLSWLAAHQEEDGAWDAEDFQQHCPDRNACKHPAIRRMEDSIRPGLTGLCLLAFLGAGYTDQSGPYPALVAMARDWLLRRQRAHGGFDDNTGMAGYNDALATLALAEYYAQTRHEPTARALQRAAARLCAAQQPLGGWDYLPAPRTDRNDTSITAWAVQALQACEAAKIRFPREALLRACLHFARASEPDGKVWYSDSGEGFVLRDDLSAQYRYGPAMPACAALSEALLGWRQDSPQLLRQRGRMLADLPSQSRARGRDPSQLHSEYYWYYGSVAMFQLGGPEWDQWNGALRDAILPLQERPQNAAGQRGHAYGSWAAYGPNWGKWGRMGGRVYTTAIAVLTLETYYRHLPAYLEQPVSIRAEDWLTYLEQAPKLHRRLATRCLPELRFELGEPPLLKLLDDPDGEISVLAAAGLASIGSPMGRATLLREREVRPPWGRAGLDKLLETSDALLKLPPAEGEIVQIDADLGLIVLSLPRSYAGMRLSMADLPVGTQPASLPSQPGAAGGELRVVRRFSGHSRVLAEPCPAVAAAAFQVGQRLRQCPSPDDR